MFFFYFSIFVRSKHDPLSFITKFHKILKILKSEFFFEKINLTYDFACVSCYLSCCKKFESAYLITPRPFLGEISLDFT